MYTLREARRSSPQLVAAFNMRMRRHAQLAVLLATAASWHVAVRSRHRPRTPYTSASGAAHSSPAAKPALGAVTSPSRYRLSPESVAADHETIGSPTARTAVASSASSADSAPMPLWLMSRLRPGGSAPLAKRSSSVTRTFGCLASADARMLPDTPAPAVLARHETRGVPGLQLQRVGQRHAARCLHAVPHLATASRLGR